MIASTTLTQINVGPITGPGAIGVAGDDAGLTFGNILSASIGIMTIVAAIFFLFNIITGGIAIINSGGDKQKVADAKGKITNGIIGLVVIIAATFIVQLVAFIFGIDAILQVANWIPLVSLDSPNF